MRIIAFIQDEHSIKDIMRAEGLPDFRAPPAIAKFIDTATSQDTYELSSWTSHLSVFCDGSTWVA